jgi:hypothetical protein
LFKEKDSNLSTLLKLTINSIVKNDGENIIYLSSNDKVYKLSASERECCERCYIYDYSNLELLNNSTIYDINITETNIKQLIPYALEETWGYRINTSNGEVVIWMKLIHNGCYDGGLCVDQISEKRMKQELIKFVSNKTKEHPK